MTIIARILGNQCSTYGTTFVFFLKEKSLLIRQSGIYPTGHYIFFIFVHPRSEKNKYTRSPSFVLRFQYSVLQIANEKEHPFTKWAGIFLFLHLAASHFLLGRYICSWQSPVGGAWQNTKLVSSELN